MASNGRFVPRCGHSINAQRSAGLNPPRPVLRGPWMSAVARQPKTFNNCLSFERGFWQMEIGHFSAVPKRSVFGMDLNNCCAEMIFERYQPIGYVVFCEANQTYLAVDFQ
jgi:hypothetical protein